MRHSYYLILLVFFLVWGTTYAEPKPRPTFSEKFEEIDIPARTYTLPVKGPFVSANHEWLKIYVKRTQYYNVHILYDMVMDPTQPKNIVCDISGNYKTWVEYPKQGKSAKEDLSHSKLGHQIELVFMPQGKDEEKLYGRDESNITTDYFNHVADKKGELIFHVENQPGKWLGYWHTHIQCRYVDPNSDN